MITELVWPSKPLSVEAVRPYLPDDFAEMTAEEQDAAYLLADWRAKNPGKDLDDLKHELNIAAFILIGILCALIVSLLASFLSIA